MTAPTVIPLAELTEKQWTTQVVELARILGWSRYHTFRSDRSAPGWPDEALVRDRLVLLELKTENGKLSPAQRDWIAKLDRAGVEVYVARPRDLDALADVLRVRYRRSTPLAVATRRELANAPP